MQGLQIAFVLFCAMAGVLSKTFPYISFMGRTLSNHSYVDVSLVGSSGDGSDSVQCHTDLDSCCSSSQGPHRGDWHFPNGSTLDISGPFYETRGSQRVDLRCRNVNCDAATNGIHRCSIETNAGNDGGRETVYVGLYTSGGENKTIIKLKCSCECGS